jgi:carboxymethylenebutenolidase
MAEIDPTNSTSAELNRRAFVGLAAAAAGGAATAPAIAADLGKTHPPFVAEDDPAIDVERVVLPRPDGNIGAYSARPKSIDRTTPGVVVVMHIWGVDTQIRDVVRRLAVAGYSAIAPDLYGRFGAPSGDGVSDVSVFRPYAQKLDRAQYGGDFRAAALRLKSKSPQGKIGIVGFCMGGHIALIQGLDSADVFLADAPFYGAVKDIDPDKIRVPICGSYGERDTGIPANDVRAFQNELRVPNDIRIYPTAGHAFFDDQRSAYVPAAAEDAWMRTLAFFKEHLGQPT